MLEKYFEDIYWCFETESLFWGKIVQIISRTFQVYPKKIANIFMFFSLFLLINPDTAKSFSDIVLLLPIITVSLFSSFNKIKFDNNDIFVYWSLCSIISICDPLFEKLTLLYYLLKVFVISAIYLRPFKFGDTLKKEVMRKIDIIGTIIERLFNKININYSKCIQNTETVTAISISKCKTPKFRKSESKLSKDNSKSKTNINVLKSNNYNVSSLTGMSENIFYASVGDLAFSVDKYLSFVKSFTREISEYVYVKNLNTMNPVIFNIKTNAPNYVNANPGKGIITPEGILAISILLKPLPVGFNLHSIIVVIEYNTVPIETNVFSPQLIDGRFRKIFKLHHF